MRILSAFRSRCRHADEWVGAKLDKVGNKIGAWAMFLGIMALIGAFVTGEASALANASSLTYYYGLTMFEWLFVAAGFVLIVLFAFLRHLLILILGIVMFFAAAIAYYIGI